MNNKRTGFSIILLVSFILISSFVSAGQQITVSNLRILASDGVTELVPQNGLITNTDGSPISYGENFYVDFDATATGDIPISAGSFILYAGYPQSSYPYNNYVSSIFDLAVGATIHFKMSTSFLSNFCKNSYILTITSPASIIPVVNGWLSSKIAYAGGPDCTMINITSFRWLPQHPAYINQSTDPNKFYGFEYTIKNFASVPFDGTYILTGRNFVLNNDYLYCIKSNTIHLEAEGQPGDTIAVSIDPSNSLDQNVLLEQWVMITSI